MSTTFATCRTFTTNSATLPTTHLLPVSRKTTDTSTPTPPILP